MNTQNPTQKPIKTTTESVTAGTSAKGYIPAEGMQREFGGRKGPEATRYNDWELNGKCVDF